LDGNGVIVELLNNFDYKCGRSIPGLRIFA